MSRAVISTSNAPAAVGPYSQAVVSDDLVFCSGQVGLDPATGELVTGGIEPETRRSLDNLTAVLAAAGVGFDQVVKITAYLTNIADFKEFNQVYGDYVGESPPARATVGIAALPMGACVEIECIARRT